MGVDDDRAIAESGHGFLRRIWSVDHVVPLAGLRPVAFEHSIQ